MGHLIEGGKEELVIGFGLCRKMFTGVWGRCSFILELPGSRGRLEKEFAAVMI